MGKQIINTFILFYICLIFIDCKKPFTPELNQTDVNVLVVEGYIDGSDTISFKLSRSRKIYPGDTAVSKNELHARITIEDNQRHTYPLIESGNGLYRSNGILNLSPVYQYRLHFFTSDGKEYLSDFVPYKVSPPIDSVGWELLNGGVQVYVNTHDVNNKTRYYRWEYSETWQFHSRYNSILQYDPVTDKVVYRTESIYMCWRSNNSSSIIIGSTAKLANDVLSKGPIVYISYPDNRLSVLYSILVKQYPLDENGYNYLLALKSNTENTGSISDPQPSQTSGNIHNLSNPSERIIGYVSAGNHLEQRMFISARSLTSDWFEPVSCSLDSYPFGKEREDFNYTGLVPVDYDYGSGSSPLGYLASSRTCVDCTLFGTTTKPSFWP